MKAKRRVTFSVAATIGLAYVAVVLAAPLGLWLLGIQAAAGWIFGGREYVLSLSGAAVVCVLFAIVVIRHRALVLRWWRPVAAACAAVVLWTVLGLAHHGIAQTVVGLRITLLPLALIAVMAALGQRERRILVDVMSWLVIANGLAAVAELIIGPARLVEWGFEEDRAIRYIDGVFRAPGLTEFNAELGMLAGAYLLGYIALWLTAGAHPHRRLWHAGAIAAAVALALSTSRSGALLVVGGALGAVLLNRSPGRVRRRISLVLAIVIAAGVAAGFAVLGATGASSLRQRLDVWAGLLDGVPLLGSGFGSAGAATTSRISGGPQVFVDNYFISVALQFGPIAAIALLGWLGYLLVRLARRSATDPRAVPLLAGLTGLACASLVVETWEYGAGMMCLIVFALYGSLRDPGTSTPSAGSARPLRMPGVPSLPGRRSRPPAGEPVG
ncbi:O-antigen ligase family protein [Phytohabitans aurantiacus]|jgi:hypothetical protein|uniref:O-antigen polymerase n=1 Tax=Phytohabitans aurantiacus TaxID=3016789 RepID=A0ABQ5QWY0_9ACTN|nr:hypothetical protein [Phytohabitans aurantiacus]GLH99033.1 hypothetical protein Pa4123_43080 [Phytohabitans aurantiacus]